MIVYLETSALVPLIIAEPGSGRCRSAWDSSDAVLCAEIGYVEAAAALARARRTARMTVAQHGQSLSLLDRLWEQMVALPVDGPLVREAASLAADHALRASDAVHCAAALRHRDSAVVVASGDQELLAAWRGSGLDVIDTSA